MKEIVKHSLSLIDDEKDYCVNGFEAWPKPNPYLDRSAKDNIFIEIEKKGPLMLKNVMTPLGQLKIFGNGYGHTMENQSLQIFKAFQDEFHLLDVSDQVEFYKYWGGILKKDDREYHSKIFKVVQKTKSEENDGKKIWIYRECWFPES